MKKPKLLSRKPSVDDMIIEKATEAAVREMVAWMKAGGVDLGKRVEQLNHKEMTALATIARDAYTAAVSKLLEEHRDRLSAEYIDQIDMWLA